MEKWKAPLSSLTIRTETSPDGITTIVLQPTTSQSTYVSNPSFAPREVPKIKQEPIQDFPSVETKDKTYEPLGSHLNNRLNCGGQVKIMVQKQETLQLQLPEFQIPMQPPLNDTTLNDSELEIASTMEIQDENSFGNYNNESEAYQNYDGVCGEDFIYSMGQSTNMCEILVTDMDTVVETEPSGQYIQLLTANVEYFMG